MPFDPQPGASVFVGRPATSPTSGSGGELALFSDEADHALVQSRVGLVYGFVGVASLVFYLTGIVFFTVARPADVVRIHLSPMKVGHLLLSLVCLAAFTLRREDRLVPRRALAAIDLGGGVVLTGLAATTTMGVLRGFPLELVVELTFMLWATLRAAVVPSPPRWTTRVTSIAAVPVVLGAYVAYQRDPTWQVTLLPKSMLVVMTTVWAIAGVAASALIARVVYGLRREVKSATRLGQYTLGDKLGEGGMGAVYRAQHALLRRPTAIKLISQDAAGAATVRRFEREVQTTSMLTHPNTVAVFDFGRTRDGVFYYAMELLDGASLQELVEREGPQPAGRVVHILLQVCGALAEAHALGLVHRDVKPANVFLGERGGIADFVKVLDFGLVKEVAGGDTSLSTADGLVGTPLYMAPECITHPERVDARTDLYALGGVAYFLLTGAPPFEGANLVEVCGHHLHTDPAPPSERLGRSVPEGLERLVLACLAKAPGDRPESAVALAAELSRCREVCPWSDEDARDHARSARAPSSSS